MGCGSPPGIPHGHHVNPRASYNNGSTAQYACSTAYSMIGSSSLVCIIPTSGSGTWQGTYPVCKLEFLETAWFWLLIGILGLLTLGLLSCLIWFCIRYCCNNRSGRRRKVRDAEDVEEDQSECSRLCCGCCFYCMRTPGDTKDGCCDYFGCCGYAGCCSCCCWCCRCCREIVEPEHTVRVRHVKQNHRPIFSLKRQKTVKSKKKKKMAILKLSTQRQIVKSNMLPTTKMVRSMIQDDPKLFRRVAKTLPVWMPHTNSVRNINTSTK